MAPTQRTPLTCGKRGATIGLGTFSGVWRDRTPRSPRSQSYTSAESVAEIVQSLLQWHPDLATARILTLFQETASKKNGRVVQGTVKKLSGIFQYYAEGDFLLVVALDVWNGLSQDRRIALIDHLLERCFGEEGEDTEMKWTLREPDIVEFSTILRRHGAYNDDLVNFMEIAQSLEEESTTTVSERVHVRAAAEV